jgi:plasmid stabilization system protein ParE
VSRHVVQLAPTAEADIREAFIWYRERNALIADAFRAEVFDAIAEHGDGARRGASSAQAWVLDDDEALSLWFGRVA